MLEIKSNDLFLTEDWSFLGFKDTDILIAWTVSIDESFIDQGQHFAIVGSVSGTMAAWQAIMPLWRQILEEFKVPYFHATEFNSRKGIAKHLDIDQRNECVKRLIASTKAAKLEYNSFAIDTKLFESILAEFPEIKISLYDFLLHNAINFHYVKAQAYQSLIKEELKVLIIVESGCPLKHPIYNAIQYFVSHGKLSPIALLQFFAKDQVQCQIADMIAYDTGKTLNTGKANYNTRMFINEQYRPSFERLIEGNKFRLFISDENSLRLLIPRMHTLHNKIVGGLPT